MHLVLLPAFLLALLGGAFGGSVTQPTLAHSSTNYSIHSLYSVAAQGAVTATVTTSTAVTATTTTSGTVAQNTPVPLPTTGPGSSGSLRLNPFDVNFLSEVPEPPMGPFAWAFLVLMLGLFGVSAYFYFFKRVEWKRTNSVYRRAAERWGPWGLWVSGLGLLFLVFRVVRLDILNKRFWLYLWLLGAIALIGWFYYWYRTQLPTQLAKYQKTQRARQYLPGSAKKGPVKSPVLNPRTPTTTTSTTTSAANSTGTSTTRVVPTDVASGTTGAATGDKKRRRRK